MALLSSKMNGTELIPLTFLFGEFLYFIQTPNSPSQQPYKPNLSSSKYHVLLIVDDTSQLYSSTPSLLFLEWRWGGGGILT